ERCAYSAPLRQHIASRVLKIQLLLQTDRPGLCIHHKFLAYLGGRLPEAIGYAGVGADVGIGGRDVQHRRSRGSVLSQADAVPVLREHGRVVIGVGDVDPELGGASPGRISAI
uniref:Uncharacterized protein n=1 Tax=Catharus ustulatus TaxID=91951 RepID=A0A8C3U181_CATUS